MLDLPMQTGGPNGVRSSDWLDLIMVEHLYTHMVIDR